MSVSNPTSLHQAIQRLKEVVTNLAGEHHESQRLILQMEALAQEIERKSGYQSAAQGSPPFAPNSAITHSPSIV